MRPNSYNYHIQMLKPDETFIRQWEVSGEKNGQFDCPIVNSMS